MLKTFVSNMKEKTFLEQNELVQNISRFRYKYELYKAKEENRYKKEYCECFDYMGGYDDENNEIYHITDVKLAESLYEILITKQLNLQDMPDEFENIKFVTVNKLKQVVFIKCDVISIYAHKTSKDVKERLSSFYKLVNWFTETFSTEGKNIHFNYSTFLYSYLCHSQRNWSFYGLSKEYRMFWDSFFRSMSVTESDTDMTYKELVGCIDYLLSYCEIFYGIGEFCKRIRTDPRIFFGNISKGIYTRGEEPGEFCLLPENLRINILRYALKQDCFSNPKDFFEENCFTDVDSNHSDVNIIFDEQAFQRYFYQTPLNENDNFVIYEPIETIRLGTKITSKVIKIKDKTKAFDIQNNILELANEGLLGKIEFFYAPQSDEHYFCNYEENEKMFTLSQYIEKIGNNPKNISQLILLINDVFSNKASIRQKVFFDRNINQLDVLLVDNNESCLCFADITALSFEKKEKHTTIQYPLCIMQVVEKFMEVNSIGVEDIYIYDFIKLFPREFTVELIQYLTTKVYKAKGLIGKLKSLLAREYEASVEFIENIPTDNTELLQRITFLPNNDENALVQELKKCKIKPKSTINNVDYISLEDNIQDIVSKGNMHLSTKLLSQLINFDSKGCFLCPEKVIISKDIYDETNYIIIGIIWNHSKLYKLSDLVKNKVINTRNIYQKLVYELVKHFEIGYCADKVVGGIGELLLNEDLNVIFNYNSVGKVTNHGYRTGSLEQFYNRLTTLISSEFDSYLDNCTYFTYNQLSNGNSWFGYNDLVKVLKRIDFCEEHNRLFLPGGMCPICDKIYLLETSLEFSDRTLFKTQLESFSIRSFGSGRKFLGDIRRVYNGGIYHCDYDRLEQCVKLGIEHDMYSKYPALVPEKILLTGNVSGANKVTEGIVYSDYDFSNVISLETFHDVQRLKVVLVLYKKILPYIEDGSFIVSDIRVFDTMFMDRNYKAEIIIPNLAHLRCDIILSSDEELKKRERENTLKLFSKFLCEYITGDECLQSELSQEDSVISGMLHNIEKCIFDEADIREYLALKNRYCRVHGSYFSSSDCICPGCISDGISKNDVIVLDNLESFEKKEPKYEGGEAKLYLTDRGKLVKLFNDKVNHSFKSKVIGKALQKAKLFEEFNNSHEDIKFVQIEKVLYSYSNNVLCLEGYSQEFIEGSFKISSFKEREFAESNGYERKDIIEILIKVCKGIEYLHSIGGFIGDLNGGNILIKDKTVYIIDMDGMSYDDVKNCVYTDMYIYPPSAKNKNITALDDWYSLAIQAFYYLTYSHPFRGMCDDPKVPINEVERMEKGFSILGNHGIKIPNISIGWDLMPKFMIDFFLETFEGNRRESMLETLQSYLQFVTQNEMKFEQIVRKNNVYYEISENMYIDTNCNLYYNEEKKFTILRNRTALNRHGECFSIGCGEWTFVVNDNTGETFVFSKHYTNPLYAYNNKIYYTHTNGAVLFVDELDLKSKQISTHAVERATANRVMAFARSEASESVFVEDNTSENAYDIYLDMTKVCTLNKNRYSAYTDLKILYDEVSSNWIVLFCFEDRVRGIVFNKSGKHFRFTLDTKMSKSVSFYRNVLYFVDDRKIRSYNINTAETKSIYCKEVTADSKIVRIANKFVINNEKQSYMFVKS